MSWPNYFSHLTTFTIISGLISIVTAVFGFFLGIADVNENKKVIGVPVKKLKKFSTYTTLITGVLTLFLTQKHDFDTEREKSAAAAKSDIVQRQRFDSTLQAINVTLTKQDTTLYNQGVTLRKQDATLVATDRILTSQRQELANQTSLLEHQRLAFEATSNVLRTQITLQDSINRSLALGISTQRTVNQTDTGITTINFPVPNGFSVLVTVRLYVKNLNKVFISSERQTKLLIRANGNIEEMLKSRGIRTRGENLKTYWTFFSNTTLSWLDHTVTLYFDSSPPNNKIVYDDFKGIQSLGSFLANNDIRYNSGQSYLEWDMYVWCGGVIQNLSGIRNLHDVLGRSDIFIKLKYLRDRAFSLPGPTNESERVSIDRFEIEGVKAVGYGSSGTYTIENPPVTKVMVGQVAAFINTWWGQSVAVEDAWRYAGVQVSLKNMLPQ